MVSKLNGKTPPAVMDFCGAGGGRGSPPIRVGCRIVPWTGMVNQDFVWWSWVCGWGDWEKELSVAGERQGTREARQKLLWKRTREEIMTWQVPSRVERWRKMARILEGDICEDQQWSTTWDVAFFSLPIETKSLCGAFSLRFLVFLEV